MVFVADSAKKKKLTNSSQNRDWGDYFIRVSVTSGGCSGLTYNLDFDNESKPNDQVFEDNGIKVVTDLRSFLYLCNTTLEFSGGLNGKGFISTTPMPAGHAVVEKVLLCNRCGNTYHFRNFDKRKRPGRYRAFSHYINVS